MAVSPYFKYGLHNNNAIKLFAIITLATTSTMLTLVDACPSICLCNGAVVDCTGNGLKAVIDTLPQQTKTLILKDNNFQEVPDLSYLKQLEKLVISYNNIRYINTSRIASLMTLKELDLSHNKIRFLPLKLFASGNKLQKLDLSFNNLTGIDGLSSPFPNLKYLNLQHNKLRNLDVIRRNQMPKLNILRAGHNDIKELVSTHDKASAFPKLHVLEFNNNKIERIDMFLTRFKNIRKLVLSHNKLKTINASSFIRNTEMDELYLDHNELSSVTNLWLTFKRKLTYLDLSYNRLHNIDASAFHSAQHIKYLDISNNKLGSLESKIFFHLRNLSYLNLHNNQIVFVAEDAFYNLNLLLSLNLSHNEMNLGDKEFDSAFKPLKLLKILDLNKNNILLIPSHAFAGLANLKTLYMKYNRIKVIETDAFSELKSITKMHFDSDDLECDCSLKYLRNYIRNKSPVSSMRGVCFSPLWLKGRNVTDVLDSEVVCVNSAKPMVRPVICVNPRSKYVHLHGNISLYCVTTSSVDSEMTISWYQSLNSKVVEWRPTYTSKQESVGSRLYKRSSRLKLRNVRFQDGGQYWCHVSNMYGSDWSKEANISVVVRPSLSPDLKREIVARSGDDVLIPCSAEGLPTPRVNFKRGGDLPFLAVEENRIVYTSNHKFGIQKLKIEDSGFYSCIATSDVGTVNATIRLVVIEEPKFVRPMKSKSFVNGTTAVIDCIISGNPRPKITWYKNNRLLTSSSSKVRLSNQLLVIISFDYRDEGVYACQASNRLGTVRTTAHLTVRPRDLSANSSSKMASDVFISIIVVVVVVVIILTSLAWATLICFCRKRRNRQEEKREKQQHFVNYPGEPLLSDLPKNYVLRCNGKLVTVQKSEEVLEESTDALLAEKQLTRVPQQREHFYGIPMIGNRQQTENEDDSGISLVYTKYPSRDSSKYSHDSSDSSKYSHDSSRDSSKYSNGSSRDLSKYTHDPAVVITSIDVSGRPHNKNPYQVTTKPVENNTSTKKDNTIPNSNFPISESKDRRKSSNKSSLPTYHPPKQGMAYVDTNSYSDDKYIALQQKKVSESNNRLNNKNTNTDFDPARLKLRNTLNTIKPSQARFTNFSSDCVQDTEDYYHSYVTSSSGIESGGSSENVSLNSEEIISSDGVVAV